VATDRLLRLKSETDFERVRRDGRSHAHPLVVVLAWRRAAAGTPAVAGEVTRVGFAAGRKVGPAVARNRAKRLLREAVRHLAPQLAGGWDVVLIARAPLAHARLAEAVAAVTNVLRRARVLAAGQSAPAGPAQPTQSHE
jgi:ribonuclease P protein component